MYIQKFDPVPEVKGFTNEELLMPKRAGHDLIVSVSITSRKKNEYTAY